MRRFTAAQARQHFSEMLDAAARGEPVVIERAGVRFGVQVQKRAPKKSSRKPTVAWVDPQIEDGQWSWELGAEGASLSLPRGRRK